MEIRAYESPALKFAECYGFFGGILVSIICAIRGDWDVVAFLAVIFVLMVLVNINPYIICKRRFVFDETGINMFFGDKFKKHYEWDKLKCVYYNNDSLSKAEKKKFERSRMPINSRVNIYDTSRLTMNKRPMIMMEILLTEKDERFPLWYMASKSKFLSKMNEWGVCLHSSN